jgi:hypothetical protein
MDDLSVAGLFALAGALSVSRDACRPGVYRCEDRTLRRRRKAKAVKRAAQKAGRKAARKGKR